MTAARMRLILHVAGLVLLLAGYGGAGLAWRAQDRIDEENAALRESGVNDVESLDSRQRTRQLEQYYGKAGVAAASELEWAQGFLHGRGLAKTLVVLSSAAAIGCFVAAGKTK